MTASKLKRHAEEWHRIEIAVEEAERTGSLQAVSDLLEKECAAARRDALEEAARFIETHAVSTSTHLGTYVREESRIGRRDMTRATWADAIRALTDRTPATANARERGEEPQP